jgi:hypothetical protein
MQSTRSNRIYAEDTWCFISNKRKKLPNCIWTKSGVGHNGEFEKAKVKIGTGKHNLKSCTTFGVGPQWIVQKAN